MYCLQRRHMEQCRSQQLSELWCRRLERGGGFSVHPVCGRHVQRRSSGYCSQRLHSMRGWQVQHDGRRHGYCYLPDLWHRHVQRGWRHRLHVVRCRQVQRCNCCDICGHLHSLPDWPVQRCCCIAVYQLCTRHLCGCTGHDPMQGVRRWLLRHCCWWHCCVCLCGLQSRHIQWRRTIALH